MSRRGNRILTCAPPHGSFCTRRRGDAEVMDATIGQVDAPLVGGRGARPRCRCSGIRPRKLRPPPGACRAPKRRQREITHRQLKILLDRCRIDVLKCKILCDGVVRPERAAAPLLFGPPCTAVWAVRDGPGARTLVRRLRPPRPRTDKSRPEAPTWSCGSQPAQPSRGVRFPAAPRPDGATQQVMGPGPSGPVLRSGSRGRPPAS